MQLQTWQDVPSIPMRHCVRSNAHRRDNVDLPLDFARSDASQPEARRGHLMQAAAALAVAVLLAAMPALDAAARQIPMSILPGLGSDATRVPVDVTTAPWFAVGRLQTELGALCTGALIGPRTVLTAAHCLVSPNSLRYVQPGSIHFLLGYSHGDYTAHARAVSFVTGRDEAMNAPGNQITTPSGADWAVVTLANPIGRPGRVLRLLPDPPPSGTQLALGGYEQDRAHVMVADLTCTLLGLARDAVGHTVLHHSCAGTRGASGGPLLARQPDGSWGIVGIASTATVGASGGYAVPVGAIDRTILDAVR